MKHIYALIILSIILLPFIVNAECNEQAGEVCLEPSIPVTDVNIFIGQIIYGIMGVVGSLALVMFIYGGLTWMTAGGAPEKVTKGKNILLWATIGLIVIFSAYTIVYFVIEKVSGITPDENNTNNNGTAITSPFV